MLLFLILASASLVCAIVPFVISNFIVDFFLALLALLLAIIAFSTKYYTYLYIPATRMKNRNIVVSSAEPYFVSPSGTSIVIRDENGTYATSFVNIPMYRSGTEMTAAEKLDIARMFSRMLTVTKSTVKFSSELYMVSKDEYIAQIRKRLEQAEERLHNLTPSDPKQRSPQADRVKGETQMWHNLLNSISGSKSESLMSYAMVSAFGGNEEEASNIAYQRAEELAAGISSVFGISAYVIKGDEMLKLIEPEYMIPVETVNEMIRQKSIEEGI